MSRGTLLFLATLTLLAGLYVALEAGPTPVPAFLHERQAELVALRAAHPVRAAAYYFVLYVLATALSVPGAALLTLAGGALFGLVWGTLIVSFASSIGATLAFLGARFLFRDWIAGRFARPLAAVDAGIRRDGAYYLFTLRLVPVFPFVLINLLFGLTAMPARTFYGVSQVGMLAGTLAYVNAGVQLGAVESPAGVLSPGLLLAFVILGGLPLIGRLVARAVQARRAYAGWTRPARFDRNLIVIGGGSAGLVAAHVAATLRAKVTLVENNRLGGDCLNTGCVPSKALLRPARLLAEIARSGDYGIQGASARFDFAEVMARVRRVIAEVEPHDSAERYRALGVEVIAGTARLVSPWEVAITAADGSQRRLAARAIIIAAGARPRMPAVPGLAEAGCLTSETLWSLQELPRRLVVLGGGPMGCELAQAFARFGSQVTVVESAPHLLPQEEPEVSDLIERRLRSEGIDVAVATEAQRCLAEEGGYLLVASRDGHPLRIPCDRLLAATGRVPRLTGYGLEELGISAEARVAVDDCLRTRYPNIYAAGDVAGPFQFTHTAARQAWQAAVNGLLAPFWSLRVNDSVIPRAVFTDPEVARVGVTEAEARARGLKFEVTVWPLADLDRAITDGAREGFVKVLTVHGRDRLLGVTIVGERAGDLIAEYALAMQHGIGLNGILGTLHAYPTYAAASQSVAGLWKRHHAPAAALALAARFHAWRRGESARP